MSEIHYFRNIPGIACGGVPGTREGMTLSPGVAVATMVLDAIGDSWIADPDVDRQPGPWTVFLDVNCTAGGGPPNKIRVQVQKRNSQGLGCLLLQTIIDETITVAKGVTAEYNTSPVNPGGVTIDRIDEHIWIILTDAGGTRVMTLRYGNAAGTDADSRIDIPDPVQSHNPFLGLRY